MPRTRRSLVFLLAAALVPVVPPALEAQTAALALVCDAAQQKPIELRIDYQKERVNRFPATFTHDQIAWQVDIRNGPTTLFKYDRNSGSLSLETLPAAVPGRAAAAKGPIAAAVPGPSYHCRRAD